MLIPTLTLWITGPIANVVVQNILLVITAVATFFLLAKLIFDEDRDLWFETGIFACLGFFAFSGTGDLNNFLTPWQTYTPAIMLGLCGLLLPRRYFVLSFALLCLSQWCNFAMNILFAILLGFQTLGKLRRRDNVLDFSKLKLQAALLGASSVFGYFLRKPYQNPESGGYTFMFDNPSQALLGWTRFWSDYATSPRASLLLIWVWPCLVTAALVIFSRSQKLSSLYSANRNVIRSFLAGFATLMTYSILAGASVLAKWNGYPHRYLIPCLIIWTVCWCGLFANLLPDLSFRRKFVASLFIIPICGFRLGWPLPGAVSTSISARLEPDYKNVAQARCTHVVGDYYRVWDSVYYSRVVGGPELWGIAHRSTITYEKWNLNRFTDPRVCFWADNKDQAFGLLNYYRISGLVFSEVVGDIIVLKRGPAAL